ncbi:MAG: site-specific integrase, partial [Methylophilaceae bacterium]|nr:site-specific integrase [Methylophilaceae bacterium]
MLKHNPDNERIKHKYFTFLREAKRVSDPTIDGVAKALARFEEYTKYKDFKTFRHEQATGFKKQLIVQKALNKDTKLSKSTIHSTFAHLKYFFEWLAREQGYKSRIQYSDAEYFNTSNRDLQVATARRVKKAPTLEQIKHVIDTMPTSTEIEQRNQALIAFTLLTGARDSAIASAKLKHINLDSESFNQDARDVNTKFSKTFI